jgi:hypothetical protein
MAEQFIFCLNKSRVSFFNILNNVQVIDFSLEIGGVVLLNDLFVKDFQNYLNYSWELRIFFISSLFSIK